MGRETSASRSSSEGTAALPTAAEMPIMSSNEGPDSSTANTATSRIHTLTLANGQVLRRIAALPGGLVHTLFPSSTVPRESSSKIAAQLATGQQVPLISTLPSSSGGSTIQTAPPHMHTISPRSINSSSIATSVSRNSDPTGRTFTTESAAAKAVKADAEMATSSGSNSDEKASKSVSRRGQSGHRKGRCPGRDQSAVEGEGDDGGGGVDDDEDDEDDDYHNDNDASFSVTSQSTASVEKTIVQQSSNNAAAGDETRVEFVGAHTPIQLTERAPDDGKGRCAYCNHLRFKRSSSGELKIRDMRHNVDIRTYTRFKCFECNAFLCITESISTSCWYHYHVVHFPPLSTDEQS